MKTKFPTDIGRTILYASLVAVCFLYTGSAYMSQFYRLMPHFEASAVDMITSCLNYALQAAGILLFSIGLKFKPDFFGAPRFLTVSLLAGLPFMIMMQLASSSTTILAAGSVFQLLIGVYMAGYHVLFARHVPIRYAALAYGVAYALGSVGTYVLSLFGAGAFLTSKGIAVLYIALALLAVGLVEWGRRKAEPAPVRAETDVSDHTAAAASGPSVMAASDASGKSIPQLAAIVLVMMVISVLGSGLYYSLPQAANVNWNLIRAFYAVGLIGAGAVMNRKRWLGEILAAASLVYPLIAFSLIGEGLNNTVTLAFSYLFRGCLTVYYIISFTDIAATVPGKLHVASLGLLISRVTEAVLTLILMVFAVPNLVQILIMALFTIPLIWLIVVRQKKQTLPAPAPISEQTQKALFDEKYQLTRRESEILGLMAEGLTDDEISSRTHISRNTVRFHVSNILKKTGTASRVEAVRALQKFS